jgi:serine/threonine protein kinase
MECCKGGCLSDYIKKQHNSRLSETEARKFFRQLIEGVIYLHSNKIMHRDLKLQNLILTDSKDLKICDFGLSVQLNDEEDLHKTVCGTPNYLSPYVVKNVI